MQGEMCYDHSSAGRTQRLPNTRMCYGIIRVKLDDVLRETRNSSGDEIANVNFLYDDIVHALQNTIDSCINYGSSPSGQRSP